MHFLIFFFVACLSAFGGEVVKPIENHSEIACQFETTTHFQNGERPDGRYVWRMWRSKREVEVSQLGARDGEAWILDGAGGVMYSRVLHPERTEVLFNAMDLRILGRSVDWARCSSLVSPEMLAASFKETGSKRFLEWDVKEFQGTVGAQKWTVLWLADTRIAVSVEIESEGRVSRTVLQELHPLEKQPWDRLRSRGYEQIDYTELGDNDTEPRMKRIMSRMGIKCSHNSCGVMCLTPDPVRN